MTLREIGNGVMLVAFAVVGNWAFADMTYSDNGGCTWSYADNNDGSIMITGVKMRSPGPVTIPTFLNGRHVTRIKDDAFRDNAMITGVTIPGCIVGIGDRAFAGCANLEELTIREGVKAIGGSDAFRWCPKLKTVTIPKTLTFIRQRAFRDGRKGRRVNVASIEAYLQIGFGTGSSTPICDGGYLYVDGKPVLELEIPDGISEIKPCAFCQSGSFKRVSIPRSVKRIGSWAFQGMRGTHVVFASSIDSMELCGYAFNNSDQYCRIECAAKQGFTFAGWEDEYGKPVDDLINLSQRVNPSQRIVIRPLWRPAGRRSYAQWQTDGQKSAAQCLPASEQGADSRRSGRRCWKCLGKGNIEVSVRETCDGCNGQGIITTKVTLTDKDTWYYGSVRKESVSRRTCHKCNRTGSVSVKKEVECPQCHGTGER